MPIRIVKDDITKMQVDAIVNPTNAYLWPGGGADAAIHKAAGPQLLLKCQTLGGLSLGEAKMTPGYDLPAKYVIHTAGPEWVDGFQGERVLLRSCYKESLDLAVSHGCKSIAFPLISSGVGGYPKDKVLKEAVEVLAQYTAQEEIDIFIVLYSKNEYTLNPSLQKAVDLFLAKRFQKESTLFSKRQARESLPFREAELCLDELPCYSASATIDDYLGKMDQGFAETLFGFIDQKGLTDVEAYKRSNVSKKTFSKIKCAKDYRPSKMTAVSFAIGLRLNLEETQHLLSTAGMCLSRSHKFDVIIEYFITSGNYKTIFDVNEVLYQYDQALLGV